MIEKKKTSAFKSLLGTKKSDISVISTKLYYERMLRVSASYEADYFRKSIHKITVDYNVNEVILGDGVFPIREKSKFRKAILGKKSKNSIDLSLEEHVFVNNSKEITFDHHGKQVKLQHKLNSKTIENYSSKILENNAKNTRRSKLGHDDAVSLLEQSLRETLDADIRDLSDKFVLDMITEIFVPVFEARLVNRKKKIAILRIDAARKKIL